MMRGDMVFMNNCREFSRPCIGVEGPSIRDTLAGRTSEDGDKQKILSTLHTKPSRKPLTLNPEQAKAVRCLKSRSGNPSEHSSYMS